jgi:hypothetical protein
MEIKENFQKKRVNIIGLQETIKHDFSMAELWCSTWSTEANLLGDGCQPWGTRVVCSSASGMNASRWEAGGWDPSS